MSVQSGKMTYFALFSCLNFSRAETPALFHCSLTYSKATFAEL
ncbi:TPA: hypothetical protein JD264_14910 [Serratia fonticola]|nr:hypothetical protein [Serratia fonticola]